MFFKYTHFNYYLSIIYDYFEEIKYSKILSDLTIKAYYYDLNNLINYLENNNINSIKRINEKVIIAYIRLLENNYKATTIIRKIVTIKMFFKYLSDKFKLTNPFLKIDFKLRKEN